MTASLVSRFQYIRLWLMVNIVWIAEILMIVESKTAMMKTIGVVW